MRNMIRNDKLAFIFAALLFCFELVIFAVVPTNVTDYNPNALLITTEATPKILVVSTSSIGNSSTIYVMRYNLGGSLDTAWNSGGFSSPIAVAGNFYATSIAVDNLTSPTHLYVGGSLSDSTGNKLLILRYSYSTGALDTVFNTVGIASTLIRGASGIQVAYSSSGIYLAGNVVLSGFPCGIIARYQTSGAGAGSLDATGFNAPTGYVQINTTNPFRLLAAKVDASNRIIVAGYLSVGATTQAALLRYTTAGVLDATFGTAGLVTAGPTGSFTQWNSLTLDGSGNILAGGTSDSQFVVARYTSSGVLDTTFNTTGYNIVSMGSLDTLAQVLSNGTKVLAVGSTLINNINNFALVQFTSLGVLDTTFNTTGKVTTQYCSTLGLFGCGISSGLIYGLGKQNNGVFLTRYTAAGALDSTFGAGGVFNSPGVSCANVTSIFPQGSYAYLYSTVQQPATTSSFVPVTFNNNGSSPLMSSDWSYDGTSILTAGQPGMYVVQVSINPQYTGSSTTPVSLIVLKNTVEITGSQRAQATTLGANSYFDVSKMMIVRLGVGDTLQFQWRSNAANIPRINTTGNSSLGTPVLTSASATIYRVG